MKPTALFLVGLHLAILPCHADVIPTRRVERNAAAEQKVKARLEQLGVSPEEAERQVDGLSVQDAAYFAQNPDRVQTAAGLYWYEWLGGIAFVALIAAVLIIRVYG
jgi:hypothetical protein